jgi:hypothetical protein
VPSDRETSFFPPARTRAESLRKMSPHLVADVYLYATNEGGKTLSMEPGFGCPCSPSKSADALLCDCWPLLDGPFAPGERRRVGFVFLHGNGITRDDILAALRHAGTFYLWEGRFIGEAVVVA